MKIHLFFTPWEYEAQEFSKFYPLGIAYLGATLEKEGHDVKGINWGYKKWDEVKQKAKLIIEQEQPDIIGLSVFTNNRISSFKLCKMIKQVRPKTITVVGGAHATTLYNQILENYPEVDFVVLGEAEKTMCELTNAIKNKANISQLKKIRGIAFRHNGKIIFTGRNERINDLNSLPIPKHEYFTDQIKKHGIVYIMTSRGCPFNCKFCSNIHIWGRTVSRRTADNIFQEMLYVIKKFPDIKMISFADDEFILDNKNVINLCKLIIKNNLKIKWYCAGGRVTSINENLVYWMKKAGCISINFGIESGSPKILKNMNKMQTLPQIIRAVEICRKYGIVPNALLLIGFPGENSKTVNETIALLKKLKLKGDPGILFLVPGSEVYEFAKKQVYVSEDYWLSDGPMPFYFKENSRFMLAYWNLKISVLSSLNAEGISGLIFFLKRKFLRNFSLQKLKSVIQRYI